MIGFKLLTAKLEKEWSNAFKRKEIMLKEIISMIHEVSMSKFSKYHLTGECTPPK